MFDGPDGQIQNNNINILLNKGHYNINSYYFIKCIFFVKKKLEERDFFHFFLEKMEESKII